MDGTNPVTEAQLNQLVVHFYARVRADAALGPIFNEAIADWPEHLDKLAAFWSSVMLTSGRYKGNPMAAHLKHRMQITPALFQRWLNLWRDVSDELLPAEIAAGLQQKAGRIAESLQFALSLSPTARPEFHRASA